MIDIKYENGEIKINTGELSKIFKPEYLPLKFEIVKSVSNRTIWSIELNNNMWATYPENEMNDVIVKNKQGHFIHKYEWDVMQHGSVFYKSLWLYCIDLINHGKHPNGLVIGTHDGEFGEWSPLVLKSMCNYVVLVEGSVPQFQKLWENYANRRCVKLINTLVTTDGADVTFFEGGRGYTNSVVERVIRSWETEEIHSSERSSTSINEIIESGFKGKLDWLHLDVEGLDAKLIMSLEEKNIPPFIIFEDYNLLEKEKQEIYNWLISRGFKLHSEGGICLANK